MTATTASPPTTDTGVQPLWPAGKRIRAFGATGPQWSGKSYLGLSIAPGRRNGVPRTLAYDLELSLGDYAEDAQCELIDVPEQLLLKYGQREVTALEKFMWWRENVLAVPKGKYDVIMVDPINEMEDGVGMFVYANATKFGYTTQQFERGVALFEAAMQSYWKSLIGAIASRCQTFFFTTHLRSQFNGSTPIAGKFEPRGRKVISQLASLYLWLDRSAPREGANVGKVPEIPAGRIIKERLGKVWIGDDGELNCTPVLPPRLPEASVKAIKAYLLNPPNYKRLKADEKYIEPAMTDDERLLVNAQMTENKLKLGQVDLELAQQRATFTAGLRANPPPLGGPVDVATAKTQAVVGVDVAAAGTESASAAVAQPTTTTASATVEIPPEKMALLKEFVSLKKELLTDEQYKKLMAAKGVASAKDLPIEVLQPLVEKMRNKRVDPAKVAAAQTDDLSKWANNIATGGGDGGGAAPLGNG